MGVRYFFDAIQAWIELIDTRVTHVKTSSGGYDKTILTYEWTCRYCNNTGTARSIEAAKYLANQHTRHHPSMTKDALANP